MTEPSGSRSPRRSRSISELARLVEERGSWKAAGQRLVLTAGSFDLLHAGHVALLEAARLEGDVLIVAIESDRALRELKGPGRPLTPAAERGEILLALEPVDRVVVYEQTPRDVIAALRPDVLVTGAEPLVDELAARAMIEASGGRLVRVEPLPGHSTTALLERIRRP